jgi:hypothetical protein
MRVSRPSPAMLVALIAVFVALGGTSYSAFTLSQNSVKSGHIVNGQVKRPDIATGAVTSRKVKDFSLLAKDFEPGQLPAAPPGPAGPAGPSGPRGPSDAYTISAAPFSPPDDVSLPSATANLRLPAGVYALFARARAENLGTETGRFPCSMTGGIPAVALDSDIVDIPADWSAAIRLQALALFDVETLVTASCQYGSPLTGSGVTVWAIRVDNVQTPNPNTAP